MVLKILSLLFMTALALTLTAEANSRKEEIIRTNKKRLGSYRSILLSAGGGHLTQTLSNGAPGCGEAIRDLYEAGESLYSPVIDAAIKPLKNYKVPSGIQDDTFYHYTRSEAFMNAIAAPGANFDEIFTFLRTQKRSAFDANWGSVFYVSEDKASISFWAKYLIEFRLDPEARVAPLNEKLFGYALEELYRLFPELVVCGTEFRYSVDDVYSKVRWHPLIFLIAEDSGITVLDYGQANHWFMILSPEVFLKAQALGAKGGTMSQHLLNNSETMTSSELQAPVISVRSAYYGANARGKIPATTVTKKMRSLLNGKISAKYKVSYLDHGDPAVNVKKDFSITWECFEGGDASRKIGPLRSIFLDENAENRVIEISCR